MEINVTLNYALKNGHPVDRFIIDTAGESDAIASLINPHKVADSCITVEDDIKWSMFVEYIGKNQLIFEIPRKYTDVFNLYLKTLKVWYDRTFNTSDEI